LKISAGMFLEKVLEHHSHRLPFKITPLHRNDTGLLLGTSIQKIKFCYKFKF
jgi:hypothetical protein